MTYKKWEMLKTPISTREEAVFNRLKEIPRYLELCTQQDKMEITGEEPFHHFEKDDRIFIRRHYKGETAKRSFELEVIYLQGRQDSAKVLVFFGLLDREVSL